MTDLEKLLNEGTTEMLAIYKAFRRHPGTRGLSDEAVAALAAGERVARVLEAKVPNRPLPPPEL